MKRLLVKMSVVILGLSLAIGSAGTLSLTGFCFGEFRYLSDREFLERFLESNPSFLKPDLSLVRNVLSDNTIKEIVPYNDAKEYLASYPECCSFGWQKGARSEPATTISVVEMLLGSASRGVSYHLHWRIIDASGHLRTTDSFFYSKATSCGQSIIHLDN